MELAPWLFQALHQPQFIDMETAIENKSWIILRVPSGKLGREGSRLLSAVVYNIWEAAFRKVARPDAPIPYYVVVDEAQEIAGGMRLETLLSEGAKFGARVFVLTQSLAMLREVEGFERVVQSLLANTSTQAFFSPGAEDIDLVHDVLESRLRYGDITFDLPSLTCWLRARIDGAWQPPVLMKTEPLAFAESDAVKSLVREVIEAHPEHYVLPELGVAAAIQALQQMLPERHQELFEKMMGRCSSSQAASML